VSDHCDLLCLDLELAERIRGQLSPDDLALAAARAKALGDPTRLEVASALLYADELCGCDLAWICDRPQNLVSHHLRVLREEALVSSRRDGKMVMFSLTDDGRALLEAALDGVEAAA